MGVGLSAPQASQLRKLGLLCRVQVLQVHPLVAGLVPRVTLTDSEGFAPPVPGGRDHKGTGGGVLVLVVGPPLEDG